MARSRGWCFTLNNPTVGDRGEFDEELCDYLVYQLEKGENGTPHLQGYVYWKTMKSLRQMKKWLPRAHFEKARGSPEQNKTYCTKAEGRLDGPWEHGEMPVKGKRNDLNTIAMMVKEGGLQMVEHENPGMIIRYHKGLQALNSYYQQIERRKAGWIKPIIRIYYGETGTGKTRHCWEKYPDLYRVACHTGGTTWFDGYQGENTVLFDDFHAGMPYRLLLQMLDGYPLRMQVKGSFVMLYAKRFLFTTNVHPNDWYFNEKYNKADLIKPLLRRIEQYGKIVDFPKPDYAAFDETLPSTQPAEPDIMALSMAAAELFPTEGLYSSLDY